MVKNTLSSEDIYLFLANKQNLTKRAIRLAKEQNNERFERESMGALMQSAGYTFDSLLDFLSEYPKIFDFKDNIEKLKTPFCVSNLTIQ